MRPAELSRHFPFLAERAKGISAQVKLREAAGRAVRNLDHLTRSRRAVLDHMSFPGPSFRLLAENQRAEPWPRLIAICG